MKTRTSVSRQAALWAGLALACAMSACSTIDKDRVTYLNNTQQFQKSPKDSHALEWRSQQDPHAYSSVTVAPVRFLAPDDGLTAEQKQILVQRLQAQLQSEFATLPQNARPDGRHLEIRAAITGADKANPVVNLLADAVINFPVSMGGAAVEIEAVVQPGNQRIAAGQYIAPGRPWDLFSSLTQTGQAKNGIDNASKEFYTLVTGQEPPKATAPPSQMVAQNTTPTTITGVSAKRY